MLKKKHKYWLRMISGVLCTVIGWGVMGGCLMAMFAMAVSSQGRASIEMIYVLPLLIVGMVLIYAPFE